MSGARWSLFNFRRNKYTDFVGTWGPAIVGHADDEVLDAIKVKHQTFTKTCTGFPFWFHVFFFFFERKMPYCHYQA